MRTALYLSLLAFLPTGSALAQAVNLNFSSLVGSSISFSGAGGSIAFSPNAGGNEFQIGSSNLPGLDGLEGSISGNFTIGSITTFGSAQEAPVSQTGTLSITDGSSSIFSGTIAWDSAATTGTLGSLNTFDATNLTGFSYSGTNAALQELASDGSAIATLSFQFVPAKTLSQLASGGTPESTSFSGSLAAIPEPADSAALIGCIVFVGMIRWRRKKRTGA